jgi:hypothetical protein
MASSGCHLVFPYSSAGPEPERGVADSSAPNELRSSPDLPAGEVTKPLPRLDQSLLKSDGLKKRDSLTVSGTEAAPPSSPCSAPNGWTPCVIKPTQAEALCKVSNITYKIVCVEGQPCQCFQNGIAFDFKATCSNLVAAGDSATEACQVFRENLCCAP